MKQKETYYNQFLKDKEKVVNTLLNEYHEKLEKAKDGFRDNVKHIFLRQLYKLNSEKQTELGINQRFYLDLETCLNEDKHKSIEIEFERQFNEIGEDKVSILKNVADLQAFLEVIETIREQGKDLETENKLSENQEIKDTPIKWKGQELEFVQLVYSLFEAGYLSNDQKQVTTLVEQVANVFNFDLSRYWQQTKSNSINDRKNGYEPDIFIKLQTAYNDHTIKKILKKAQRK